MALSADDRTCLICDSGNVGLLIAEFHKVDDDEVFVFELIVEG